MDHEDVRDLIKRYEHAARWVTVMLAINILVTILGAIK